MTVVVGIVEKDGTIHMGCDSAATATSGEQAIVDNQKVFFPVLGPWFIIGFAGSFRLGQLLRYSFVPPPPMAADGDIQHYITTTFVDAMRECFEKAGFAGKNDLGRDVGGYCVVGYQGRLFRIEDDFQAIMDSTPYSAMGSGESYALGALYATVGRNVESRMETALEASCKFSAWCRPPFQVLSLPYSDDNHAGWRRALRRKHAKKKRR